MEHTCSFAWNGSVGCRACFDLLRKERGQLQLQIREKQEINEEACRLAVEANGKVSRLRAELQDANRLISEADQRGYQRAYREHEEVRQAMKARCVDKCSHSGDFVCDYEDGTSHCLECIAEKVWASERPNGTSPTERPCCVEAYARGYAMGKEHMAAGIITTPAEKRNCGCRTNGDSWVFCDAHRQEGS